MKKSNFIFALFFLVTAFSLTSCSGGGEVKGVVKDMVDSTHTLIADIDGSEGVFFMGDATYINGAVMLGDTVVINYSGSLSDAKALTVRLIPREGNVIDFNTIPSEEPLMTKPASKEEVENMKKFKDEASKAKNR